MTARDDFSASIVRMLAQRAGFQCSNPRCKRPTSGAQLGGPGAVSIGEAAHITAASPGGPRYDPSLTPAERSGQENGVWLCRTCAALVDRDPSAFTAERLRGWREDAEASAALALAERGHPPSSVEGFCYEAERLMPGLIREMRDDVHADNTELVRKFGLKPSPGVVLGSVVAMFEYNAHAHPGLYNQVEWLDQMGLVEQEDFDPQVPRYRLTPEFHRWLRETENR